MSNLKVRIVAEGAIPVNDKLAGIVPMALLKDQLALEGDIAVNGQREPILVWHGQVVDGRCRQKALVNLQRHILYKELDSNITEAEIRSLVKSMNTRRDLTTTQKITCAAKAYLSEDNTMSVRSLAESWGVSESIVENAIWLLRNYPLTVNNLFDGMSVVIENKAGQPVTSNKVSAVYAYYKRQLQKATEVTAQGWKDDACIETQAGKDWYYDILKSLPEKNISHTLKGLLIELTNLKFQATCVENCIGSTLTNQPPEKHNATNN